MPRNLCRLVVRDSVTLILTVTLKNKSKNKTAKRKPTNQFEPTLNLFKIYYGTTFGKL